MRSARLLRFGEMFQWRKTFGPLLRCANLHLRCAPPSFSLAAPSITLAPSSITLAPPSFTLAPPSITLAPLAPPTDGSIKFCSFLFCEMICQI
jgi:hypothetical protein